MDQTSPTVNQDILSVKKTKIHQELKLFIFLLLILLTNYRFLKSKDYLNNRWLEFGLNISKRSPKQLLLHRSYMVRLPY